MSQYTGPSGTEGSERENVCVAVVPEENATVICEFLKYGGGGVASIHGKTIMTE